MNNSLELLFSASGFNQLQLHAALKRSLCFFIFSTMLALALIFASCPISPVFSSPPASGYWIVTGTESYYDEVIVLNGNLVVEDGGNLTLRKVVLNMNCTYNGEFNITVESGGKLYVLEDSVITSADPDKKIGFFRLAPLSTFRMINSELHNCGSDELNLSGLMLDSDDAIVENSLLSHNTWGILVSCDSVVIRNNNITANSCGVEVHASANPIICGNFISLNNWGMATGEGSPTIFNNTITKNGGGVCVEDGSPTIYNNTITSNLGDGVTGSFKTGSTISDNNFTENLGTSINCHTYSSLTIANNRIASNFIGINCHNHTDAIIRGNTIWNNTISGIACTANSNPTIEGNTITSNLEWGGIGVSHSSPTISNNTITSNQVGIALENDANPTISSNLIVENLVGGIGVSHSSPTIANNTIKANRGDGISCHNHSNLIIQGNTITNNSGAINLHLHTTGTIQGNLIVENAGGGVGLHAHSNLTIQGNIIASNEGCGIHCSNNSIPEIHWNDIYGNQDLEIINDNLSITVNATYNYWRDGPSTHGNILLTPKLTKSIVYVEITDPIPRETVSSTIAVRANVDARNGIHKAEFYIDDKLEYTDYDSPYEWNWNTSQYTETEHRLAVELTDRFGLKASATSQVHVDNTPPSVTIEEPSAENIYTGIVKVKANATDNQGVKDVHVRLDNTGWVPLVYDPTDLLWKYELDTTTLYDGQYTVTVLALDKASSPATHSTVFLIDNNPPTVTIQTPQSGAIIGLTSMIDVQAIDASGISKIEFYLQNVLVHTITDMPYQWSWDTTKHPNGEYTITVKAYDSLGRSQTSETTVAVQNVEAPWWQTNLWTIIEVVVGISGLMLGVIAYFTTKERKKRGKDRSIKRCLRYNLSLLIFHFPQHARAHSLFS